MRTVTQAEAEKNLAAVLQAAADEPVRIRQAGRDMIVVSAAEFEEAAQLLHQKRVRRVLDVMDRASAEASANGYTEELLPELLKDDEPYPACCDRHKCARQRAALESISARFGTAAHFEKSSPPLV